MQWISGIEFIWDDTGLDEEVYFWGGKSHRAAAASIREFSDRHLSVPGFKTRVESLGQVKGDLTSMPALLRRARFASTLSDTKLAHYVLETQDVDFLFGEDDVDEESVEPAIPLMPEDDFWSLIDVLEGSVSDSAVARLEYQLRQLPVDSIKQFAERFAERLWQLDQQAIYKAYKLRGLLTLGPDGFLYYRATALADGRAAYERYLARTERFTGGINQVMDGEVLLGVADNAIRYFERTLEHYETSHSFETGSNEAKWQKDDRPRVFHAVFFVRIAANGPDGSETFIYGFEAPKSEALALAESVGAAFAADFPHHSVCAEQLFLGQTEDWTDTVRAFGIRHAEKPALGALPASRIPETVIAL